MFNYDYRRLSSNEIFTSGSTNNAVRCVNINILDDDALESNQTFTVMLTTSDPDVNIQTSTTLLTVTDNDGWFYNFAGCMN